MIKYHIYDGECPGYTFTSDIEGGAITQIHALRNLPFAYHVAIMPDVHKGYGMPIGGVLGTDVKVVIPNAVGVDIGCGMQAVKTNILVREGLSRRQKDDLYGRILDRVPVGFNVHPEPVDYEAMPECPVFPGSIVAEHWHRACQSLGTLGGGNHFMEVQAGDDGHLWLMVHCGSRNLGKQVCDHYNRVARSLNAMWRSKVEARTDLAFLPAGDQAFDDYMRDMKFCIEFAKANRSKIMDEMLTALGSVLCDPGWLEMERIDICHNHARREFHLGKNMMVHRKGAAGPLWAGRKSIIPGSQGTSSFIVGPRDTTEMKMALSTTSHGAGRPMSRSDAKKTLDLKAQEELMADVVHGKLNSNNLDEAPGAYKDIHKVIAEQEALCEVLVRLTPLVNMKG